MVRSGGTPITPTEEDRKHPAGIMENPQSRRRHAWCADIIPIPAVRQWRKCFAAERVDGLSYDATCPPGKAPISADRARP